jgi:quercetin dioxygenase-like cupin family protein
MDTLISNPTRREMIATLSLLAGFSATALHAQGTNDEVLPHTQVFSPAKLKVVTQTGGWETRQILRGALPTGEHLDVHQSTLPAGQMPHAPHRHRHAEMMVLLEGKIDFYNGTVTEPMQPGDLVFAAPDQLHGWKNVGETPARYFVIAVGTDPK